MSYPTGKQIIKLKCQLYANGAAVESDLTTGHDHGHIGHLCPQQNSHHDDHTLPPEIICRRPTINTNTHLWQQWIGGHGQLPNA